eukprot:bmy_12457T0
MTDALMSKFKVSPQEFRLASSVMLSFEYAQQVAGVRRQACSGLFPLYRISGKQPDDRVDFNGVIQLSYLDNRILFTRRKPPGNFTTKMVEVYDPGTDRLGSKLSGGQGLPVHDSDQYPGSDKVLTTFPLSSELKPKNFWVLIFYNFLLDIEMYAKKAPVVGIYYNAALFYYANNLFAKGLSYQKIIGKLFFRIFKLLDCFVIPVVILLSWFFLLIRYKAVHFLGIIVCILGMGCMAGADVLVGRHQGAGENKLVGDLLVLGGATLYGISNVWEEYIIRTLSRVEFLGMIGLFGAFFRLLYVGFSACMFGLYSFMPVVIKKTSATSVNLSLLTADLYSLFCGLFLFHYKQI